MIRFAIWIIVATAVLLGAVFLAVQRGMMVIAPSFAPETVLFVALTTIFIYFFLHRQTASPQFTQAYLLSMVLKMIAYAAFVLVIILRDKHAAAENALIFLASYLVCTTLEIAFLFRRINR